MSSPGLKQKNRKYGNVGGVKTTLDLPDEIFRQSKARAALLGQSLKSFVAEALTAHLAEESAGEHEPPWRSLFGAATRLQVSEVDAVVEAEFGRVDPALWD